LYNFYIDESGAEGLTAEHKQQNLDSDWFTAGGIIVNDEDIMKFEHVHDTIMENCFISKGLQLPPDFKLHYHELRQNVYPYNQLENQERWGIANTIFDSINSIDCKLISTTINKSIHEDKYDWSVNVRAYTLLICLERFQFFLEDYAGEGKAIYERFSNNLRRKMTKELQLLQSIPTFPYFTNMEKIKGKVRNGDPVEERILQFSDFFVYAPHIKLVTSHKADRRWQQIKNRYYELYGSWKKCGYVVI